MQIIALYSQQSLQSATKLITDFSIEGEKSCLLPRMKIK